ncbi:MAG: DUF362 domain-containing protein [Opitutaceae bacterium]
MNTRRDFIKKSITLGAVACAIPELGRAVVAEAAPVESTPKPVLVAVRDGSRSAMLDRALTELGGLQAFLKPGQSVVIKPNIGWNVTPERGGDTHPELVAHLVKLCLAAGAKTVNVFDYTCNPWRDCYTNSGIEDAVKAAGGTMMPGNDKTYYREVEIPNGKVLKKARVHQLVLDSDVFFNVPVLKHHSGSLMTASMKNLMGVIWDRSFYHRADLHQCIADFVTFKRPTLNILDAYHPMFRNGPRGLTVEDLVEKRMLFACTDIVAIDAAAARVLDHDPADIRHIAMAAQHNVGIMDLSKVDVRRVKLA